jgi:hypothetical protein
MDGSDIATSSSSASASKMSYGSSYSWVVIILVIFFLFFILILLFVPWGSSNDKNCKPSSSSIVNSQPATLLSNGNYGLSASFNRSNIVLPAVNDVTKIIAFQVDVSQVKMGDLFTIDNSQNPLNTFKVIYSGFDNNQSSDKVDEVMINNGKGILNTVLINITAGKGFVSGNVINIDGDMTNENLLGKNILITASPMYMPS